MKMDGVGEKIADCVLLFAYGFPGAFPVDVWVRRVLTKFYFRGRTVKPERLRQFMLRQGVLNRRHLRSFSVTAERVAAACEAAGLCCRSQELVNWRQRLPIDAFTVFCRKDSRWARPNRVQVNTSFMREAELCAQRALLYDRS